MVSTVLCAYSNYQIIPRFIFLPTLFKCWDQDSEMGKEGDSLGNNAITHGAIRNTIVTVLFFFFFPISRKVSGWNYKDWRVNTGGTSELLLKRHMIASQIGKIVAHWFLLSIYISGWAPHVSFNWDEFEPIVLLVYLFWCVPRCQLHSL